MTYPIANIRWIHNPRINVDYYIIFDKSDPKMRSSVILIIDKIDKDDSEDYIAFDYHLWYNYGSYGIPYNHTVVTYEEHPELKDVSDSTLIEWIIQRNIPKLIDTGYSVARLV